MKIKLKFSQSGSLAPQHPDAPLGFNGSSITIEVIDLPDGSRTRDAIEVAERTVFPSWLNVIHAHQKGMNLYIDANLTDYQLSMKEDQSKYE